MAYRNMFRSNRSRRYFKDEEDFIKAFDLDHQYTKEELIKMLEYSKKNKGEEKAVKEMEKAASKAKDPGTKQNIQNILNIIKKKQARLGKGKNVFQKGKNTESKELLKARTELEQKRKECANLSEKLKQQMQKINDLIKGAAQKVSDHFKLKGIIGLIIEGLKIALVSVVAMLATMAAMKGVEKVIVKAGGNVR